MAWSIAPSAKAIYHHTFTAFGAEYCMDRGAAAHMVECSATEITKKNCIYIYKTGFKVTLTTVITTTWTTRHHFKIKSDYLKILPENQPVSTGKYGKIWVCKLQAFFF